MAQHDLQRRRLRAGWDGVPAQHGACLQLLDGSAVAHDGRQREAQAGSQVFDTLRENSAGTQHHQDATVQYVPDGAPHPRGDVPV
jgi:hypothetical protein